MSAYQGNSIVDYLNSTGAVSDFASRAKLATAQGIQNYTGTADQNTQLLTKLRTPVSTTPPVSAPVLTQPQLTQIAQQNAQATGTQSYRQPQNTTLSTVSVQNNALGLNPQTEITNINEADRVKQETDLAHFQSTLGTQVEVSNSDKILKSLVDSFTAQNTAPAQKSNVELLAEKRTALGIDPLETQVSTLDQQIAKLDSAYKEQTGITEDNLSPLSAIRGDQSKEEKNYTTAKNELITQKNAIATQLSQKYGVLDTYMKYAGLDYNNAQEAYNTKFTQAISFVNLLKSSEQATATAQNTSVDNARANATLMINALKDKQVNWDTLDPTEQANYNKLELQAGLPTGFMKFAMEMDNVPKASQTEVRSINGREVLINSQTGETIKDLGGATTGAGGGKIVSAGLTTSKDAIGANLQVLNASKETGDGVYADPGIYLQLYQKWTSQRGSPTDFYKYYPPNSFLNPVNTWIANSIPGLSKVWTTPVKPKTTDDLLKLFQ